jgi:hypothetical protein
MIFCGRILLLGHFDLEIYKPIDTMQEHRMKRESYRHAVNTVDDM